MKIKYLSIFEYDQFVLNHPLGNYAQLHNYGLYQQEQGFNNYDLLGFVDEEGNIKAASLILIKKIGMFNRYGYAPKGFLIDYYDPILLKEFLEAIKKLYYKKNFAFIKFNPEIAIGEVDYKKKHVKFNKNQIIESTLEGLGCRKLEGDRKFSTKMPKFNAIQILKTTNLHTVNKNTRNKINKSIKYGMKLVKGTRDDIETFYNFVKFKKNGQVNKYYDYWNSYSKDNAIDLMLVEIDFEQCLINIRKIYEKEYEKNLKLVNLMLSNPTDENLKRKLASDRNLTNCRENIAKATRCLAENRTKYIAGALIVKYKNRVNIVMSGYDKEYKPFCPNYFLHYKLIEYYKNDYDFMDLNGLTGDFSINNPYKGLDEFKLGFNPLAFEYIGEFDYIINKGLYQSMEQSGQLAKEFKK